MANARFSGGLWAMLLGILLSGQLRLCGKPNEKTFAGRIDEVKIWNRALTAAEIAAEYAPATRRARHLAMLAR
jgi:hypothetical protein